MMKLVTQLGVALMMLASQLAAADDLPSVTEDGLHRVPDTQVRAVYAKPGADLGEYNKIALLEVYVAFRKNWQRDQNREAVGLEGRIIDPEAAGGHTIQWSNRITNKAEADRIIRRWAQLLNDHLAEVKSATGNK